MEAESTTSSRAERSAGLIRLVAAIAAALMLVLLAAVLLVQIEVTDAQVAATRSCGSVFDSAVDRSGWEQWWAQDLDEQEEVRSALVRTSRCPGAVNQRVVVAAVLAIIAVVSGAVAITRRKADRSADTSAARIGRRVVQIGRLTAALGGALPKSFAQQIGHRVLELAAFMHGAQFDLAHEITGKIKGRFHETSLLVSQLSVNSRFHRPPQLRRCRTRVVAGFLR